MENINFKWTISQLERNTSDDMVFTVHYRIDANEGDYTADSYGSIGLDPAKPESKIPYEDLTEEVVIGWVIEKLGEETVDQIKDSLSSQIEFKKSPPSTTGVPW
jgi:hypothetical protein